MLGQNRSLAAALLLLISSLAQPTHIVAVGFTSAKNYPVGTTPIGIAAGDFNKDGRLDLCVANSGSLSVSILLGRGDGAFLPAVNYKVPQSPKSIAVGDFNHDGTLDVVFANAGSVSVLLGKGDGTFRPAVNTSGGQAFDSLAVEAYHFTFIP